MKITVGQFNVKSKDIQSNYIHMERLIQEAISKDYDVIVFGEYSLCGYGNADLFKENSFSDELSRYTEKLNSYSNKISIIFGSVLHDHDQHYVVANILSDSNISHSYKETLNKRELSEDRYFHSKNNQVVLINDQKVLVTFRSDLTNIDHQSYDVLIVLDSSPVNQHLKPSDVDDVVYANTIGITHNNKVVFINGGNSFIKHKGTLKAMAEPLSTGIIENDHDVNTICALDALVYGVRVFSSDNFGDDKKWIVGNSGGLDSAVTLSLLSMALGSDKLISYNLRSKFNSDKTINNAKSLASKLNVEHYSEGIDDIVDATIKTTKAFGYEETPTLVLENIQARIRGHLLSTFSGLENAIISNNANKLEIVLGYTTLYGDTVGALSIIGDLTKVEVFDLAHAINERLNDEIIPHSLLPQVENYVATFDVAPSAELKSDQKDPMKWFYHDLLLELIMNYSREEILAMYYKDQFGSLEISQWLKSYGLDNGLAFVEDFNWFMRTFQINNFKRLQAPPVLAYSNQVINVDFVEAALLKPQSDVAQKFEQDIINKYI